MSKTLISVLLIEDSLAEARIIQEVLKGTLLHHFQVAHVQRLRDALDHLADQPPDVVLLDLSLPDSQGLASLDLLIGAAVALPVVVLTNTNDDALALESVRRGAQDYLIKRQINQDLLVRSLCYAIERQRSEDALRQANEILELRVQQRTAELQTTNHQLQQEVARRQRVQERLELAQRAGRTATFEWNIQTGNITWNPELDTLYGLASDQTQQHYDAWVSRLHPEDRSKVEQELRHAVDCSPQPDRTAHVCSGLDTEFRIVHPSGETRWIAAKGSLFCDGENYPKRMLGIHMDITEKKQLEAQFWHAQRLESLGTLASGIAHDLNNIFTPISAVARLLPVKIPDLDETSQQLIAMLDASVHRGTDLVKQILSFAHGAEGKRVILKPERLLREVQQMVQQTLSNTTTIHIDVPPDLWTILGDATQLHQVFMNLVVNARDAMPQGGIIQVTAENLQVDASLSNLYANADVGPHVVVTVSDTGAGIASSVVHRIFDPFFTTKAAGKGTGLGLSAVLGIVKSHGGFVDVQSELDQGSQFKVGLPACSVAANPIDAVPNSPSGHQALILVVDDELAVCQATRVILETHNYRIVTAPNGLAAIALVTQHKEAIQGVLIDLMMPEMDGLTAIPLLRQLNPSLPVVAMSGTSASEAIAQTEKLGVNAFLAKPFTEDELLRAMSAMA